MRLDEMRLDEMGLDEMRLDEMGLDEMRLDEMGLDEMGLDEMGVDEMGLDEMGVDEMGLDKVGMHRNVERCAKWRDVQSGGMCLVTSVSFMRLWASLKRARSVVGVRPSRFGSARLR